jgi:hypothetical protein
VRPVVEFAYIIGWRVDSEVLPIEWRQVDLQAREIRLDSGSTKNGEGRAFRMPGVLARRAALAVLSTTSAARPCEPGAGGRAGARVAMGDDRSQDALGLRGAPKKLAKSLGKVGGAARI